MDILESKKVELMNLALDGLAARHKALTSNISNAESPEYKRINVEFEGQLKKIIETKDHDSKVKATNSSGNSSKAPVKDIKNPMHYKDFKPYVIMDSVGSINSFGNNVNIEKEMAELTKNGMKYNALANLQAKSVRGMKELIKGLGA